VIKAFVKTMDDGAPMVVLAMPRRETELLHEGVPARVDLARIDPRLPNVVVLLMAGESDWALVAEINGTAGRRICSEDGQVL
jgi:hypothetical protein